MDTPKVSNALSEVIGVTNEFWLVSAVFYVSREWRHCTLTSDMLGSLRQRWMAFIKENMTMSLFRIIIIFLLAFVMIKIVLLPLILQVFECL
jgi:hypothetical protein